jgi:hypothetical protein
MERNRGDKVEVLESAQTFGPRDVPEADGLVHRGREEEVVLGGTRTGQHRRRRQRERSHSEKKKHTLLQLRSSTSASCPTNSLTGRVPKTGMTQTGARRRDVPFFLPLPVAAAGTAGAVVVGVAGANVDAERPNEGTSCGKDESRGDVGLSVAARSCGLDSTSQTAGASESVRRRRSSR